MPNRFGSGTHTAEKLNKLEEYLDRFTTVLKFRRFELVYFDAFAGTPEIDVGVEEGPLLEASELKPFIEGSSARALKFGKKFSKYIFVDSKRANVHELEVLKRKYPQLLDSIETRYSEANDELVKFCAR